MDADDAGFGEHIVFLGGTEVQEVHNLLHLVLRNGAGNGPEAIIAADHGCAAFSGRTCK
ncbi:hypothetical protein D3C71_1813100 [compost metagenome]